MIKFTAGAAALVLSLNAYLFYFVEPVDALPKRLTFQELPLSLGEWRCPGLDSIGEAIEQNLGVTDYLHCDYMRSPHEPRVNVYVGYHERQVREGAQGNAESAIHPPRHCLPGSGWQIIDARVLPFSLAGKEIQANRLTIAKGNNRQLVYYWYQERGRSIASDYWKIVYLFWDRATRSRSDGSLVRFTTGVIQDDFEGADARIREMAGELLPLLARYVPD